MRMLLKKVNQLKEQLEDKLQASVRTGAFYNFYVLLKITPDINKNVYKLI